ncbi:VWA domain-containing protein [Scytonema sp. NUACC21]
MDYNITQEVMHDTLKLDEVVEFAENPEPRCPCVLLLDTSGSMQGGAIEALNEGLKSFKEELIKNSLAARRVEVAIVTFDSQINVIQDFVTADQFNPPILTAQGLTTMGAGIHKALDMIQDRKAQYRANGIAYYRPWVFMITDGEPQGEFEDVIDQAARRLQADEANKRVAFFSVGVENANMNRLSQLAVRTPLKLAGLNFVEMFVWLSASMSAVSHSKVDDQVALPPIGWGSV